MRGRRARQCCAAGLLAIAAIVAAACSSSTPKATPASTSISTAVPRATAQLPVAELHRTFGNGARSLPTLVLYPAKRDGAPYPLIAFAHGLGASAEVYRGLLERWASAGYVVAAPDFPHTNPAAPGGIDPGDYVRQPADVSAVITGMLDATGEATGPLAGLVDTDAIGAAGHSLGGITTLGLTANSCCLDDRVRAAIPISGDALTFPEGEFDAEHAPPLLFVHGTDDALVPYEASVDAFNLARGPKGLVAVLGGDHGAPVSPDGKAFDAVVRVTTDFFDAYLRNDDAAAARLPDDGVPGVTRVVFDAEQGSLTTVPTTPTTVGRVHHATVAPTTGLRDGQQVTVTWSDYTPGKTVNVVQCSQRTGTDASACDLKHGKLLQPDPTGSGSVTIEVVVGPVGTGTCDAAHDDCVIVVNDGGSLDPSASVRVPISFAGP